MNYRRPSYPFQGRIVLMTCLFLTHIVMHAPQSIASDNTEETDSTYYVPNKVLDYFGVEPDSRDYRESGAVVATGTITAASAVVGYFTNKKTSQLAKENSAKRFISIMWSPSQNPSAAKLAAFDDFCAEVSSLMKDSDLMHGFPPINYLKARGWGTEVVDIIDKHWPLEKQATMWSTIPGAYEKTVDDWKRIVNDEPELTRLTHMMRGVYADRQAFNRDRILNFFLNPDLARDPEARRQQVKDGTFSQGIADEMTNLQDQGNPYVQVERVGDTEAFRIPKEEIDVEKLPKEFQDSLKKRGLANKGKVTLIVMTVAGGATLAKTSVQQVLQTYIGGLNALKNEKTGALEALDSLGLINIDEETDDNSND